MGCGGSTLNGTHPVSGVLSGDFTASFNTQKQLLTITKVIDLTKSKYDEKGLTFLPRTGLLYNAYTDANIQEGLICLNISTISDEEHVFANQTFSCDENFPTTTYELCNGDEFKPTLVPQDDEIKTQQEEIETLKTQISELQAARTSYRLEKDECQNKITNMENIVKEVLFHDHGDERLHRLAAYEDLVDTIRNLNTMEKKYLKAGNYHTCIDAISDYNEQQINYVLLEEYGVTEQARKEYQNLLKLEQFKYARDFTLLCEALNNKTVGGIKFAIEESDLKIIDSNKKTADKVCKELLQIVSKSESSLDLEFKNRLTYIIKSAHRKYQPYEPEQDHMVQRLNRKEDRVEASSLILA